MIVKQRSLSSGYKGKRPSEMIYRKFLEELRVLKSKGKDVVVSTTLDSLIRKYAWGKRTPYFKYFVKRAEKSGFLVFVRTGVWEITDRIILYGNEVYGRSYS